MYNTCRRVLRETDGTEISFINTFQLLSIPNLRGFLQMVLDLREEFGYENQEDKIMKLILHPNKENQSNYGANN